MKLGLNELSAEMLVPLHEDYEITLENYDGPGRDGKLREIAEELTYGSLGIEHFMREIAVLYENILLLKHNTKSTDLDDPLSMLSGLMAEALHGRNCIGDHGWRCWRCSCCLADSCASK